MQAGWGYTHLTLYMKGYFRSTFIISLRPIPSSFTYILLFCPYWVMTSLYFAVSQSWVERWRHRQSTGLPACSLKSKGSYLLEGQG